MLVHSSRHDASALSPQAALSPSSSKTTPQAKDSPSSQRQPLKPKTAPSPKISQARSLFYLFTFLPFYL